MVATLKRLGMETYDIPEEQITDLSMKDRGVMFLCAMCDHIFDEKDFHFKVGVGARKRIKKSSGEDAGIAPAIGISFGNEEPIMMDVDEARQIIEFVRKFDGMSKLSRSDRKLWEETTAAIFEAMESGIKAAEGIDLKEIEREFKDTHLPRSLACKLH